MSEYYLRCCCEHEGLIPPANYLIEGFSLCYSHWHEYLKKHKKKIPITLYVIKTWGQLPIDIPNKVL